MDLLREKSKACFAASPEMSRVTLKGGNTREGEGREVREGEREGGRMVRVGGVGEDAILQDVS